jgi:TPR repeat protein
MRRKEGDYETAFKYLTRAAELGDIKAHYSLSDMYAYAQGVDKDEKKEVYHLEEAAIGGDPVSRFYLGAKEYKNGRIDRARKHFIIAANLGCNKSLKNIKIFYSRGHASKEEYADALRAYQATVEEMKSAEREKAEEAVKNGQVKRPW